jgi:Phosphodiester glycosidase
MRRALRHSTCLALSCAAAIAAIPARMVAQAGDTTEARTLAPGVTYRHVVDRRGPWNMHVVRIDLRRATVELRHVRALDSLRGRERTSAMAARRAAAGDTVLAAVNADFFELGSGESENNQVLGGEWWKGAKVTDSPYDTFDNPHAQFGLTAAGRPVLDRYILEGMAWCRGVATPILTVNLRPTATYEGTTLYTPRFGSSTPRDTTRAVTEVVLAGAGRRGDTLLYVRAGAFVASTGTVIPRAGAVLSAYGARTVAVRAMREGDTVRVLLATRPRIRAPRLLVGGWPRILANGRSVAGDAATVEGTISRNAEMRHPRSAVGFSRDSNVVVLFTVDGRSENSGGMTLVELAATMRRLGAWHALNFDGGGSTTMVVRGSVVNVPSDSTGERTVGSALVVVRHQPRR